MHTPEERDDERAFAHAPVMDHAGLGSPLRQSEAAEGPIVRGPFVWPASQPGPTTTCTDAGVSVHVDGLPCEGRCAY